VGDYKSVFYNKPDSSAWKKPAAIGLIILGFGLAIWGGYTVYKNRVEHNDKDETTITADTNSTNKAPGINNEVTDTVTKNNETPAPAVAIPTGTNKFILEISPKERALYRYNRLKTFQWQVELETNDSSLLLPVNPADTSRVLDSLSRLNGKRVYISQ
jgi:hypothetical protein